MEDITPGLLQKIQKDFQSEFDKSKTISELYKKVRDGTVTYSEANKFSIKVGEILSGAFKNNISSDILPNGRMYYNIAKGILEPTLTRNHELITDVTSRIQTALNKSANIGIKAITPEINQSRIDGLIDKVSDAEVYDDVAWVLDEPIVNFSQSIVDDTVKANAEFQHKSGLSPQIVRTSSGKCCEWCSRLVGTYEYGDVRDTGNDVFRRHSNCRCEVTFHNGKKRQDVWSKQKWIADDEILEERKNIGMKSASAETPKEREKRVANSA